MHSAEPPEIDPWLEPQPPAPVAASSPSSGGGGTNSRPERSWNPDPRARARFESHAKLVDPDLHIDRYILRCKQRKVAPTTEEWLRWAYDDEQKARTEAYVAMNKGGQETDEAGVPLSWRKNIEPGL